MGGARVQRPGLTQFLNLTSMEFCRWPPGPIPGHVNGEWPSPMATSRLCFHPLSIFSFGSLSPCWPAACGVPLLVASGFHLSPDASRRRQVFTQRHVAPLTKRKSCHLGRSFSGGETKALHWFYLCTLEWVACHRDLARGPLGPASRPVNSP